MTSAKSPIGHELLQVSLPHQAPPFRAGRGKGPRGSRAAGPEFRSGPVLRDAAATAGPPSHTGSAPNPHRARRSRQPRRPRAGSGHRDARQARGSCPSRASGVSANDLFSHRYGSHPTGPHRGPARARGLGRRHAFGPRRPAPGPAPQQMPQGDPFHALTHSRRRRTEQHSPSPPRAPRPSPTPSASSPTRRYRPSPRKATGPPTGRAPPTDPTGAPKGRGLTGKKAEWRRREDPRRSRRCLRRGIGRHRDGGGAVSGCGSVGACVGELPSRPPSTQAEPSRRGPGRQGRSSSWALHLDALDHARSTVCGSTADGMEAGVSGGWR